MSEAIFGLIGVVIGGLLTGAMNLILERRRERAQGIVGRRVARVELEEAREAVNEALRWRKWPPGWEMSWSASWSSYRPALAATMDDTRFSTLARAYLDMHLLQEGLEAGERPLSDPDEEFLNRVKGSISKATNIL